MKRIEEIERMSIEELEKIAADEAVKAPEMLEDRLEAAILASDAIGRENAARKERQARLRRPLGLALAGVAAAVAVVIATPSNPKDTFNDPEQAYAQLEKTLSMISSKMDRGMQIASEADQVVETANNALNR